MRDVVGSVLVAAVFILGILLENNRWSDYVGPATCVRNGYAAYVDGWTLSSCATYNADGSVQAEENLWTLLGKEKNAQAQ